MGWVDGDNARSLEHFKQRGQIIMERIQQLHTVYMMNQEASRYRDQMAREQENRSEIETTLNTTSVLTAADALIDDIVNALDNIDWTHIEPIYPGTRTNYESLDIDVDPGQVTAQNDSTPFADLAVGDVVKLYNCEDAENDGILIIATKPNDYTLTFSSTIPKEGAGTDNAEDTQCIIQLVQRGGIT